jgi:hypothetical protein
VTCLNSIAPIAFVSGLASGRSPTSCGSSSTAIARSALAIADCS